MSAAPILWTPDPERARRARMTRFREARGFASYAELHAWSVAQPERFWAEVWSSCGVVGEGPGEPAVLDLDRMPGARWFPEARLSFAENLLREPDDRAAIVWRDEAGARRELSRAELAGEVAALAAAFRALGLRPGDRVAGWLPNVPEAVVCMLAASAVGAVWSSASPDFGVEALVDRFGQIAPRVLVAACGSRYGGKLHDGRARLGEALARLPSVEHALLVPYPGELEPPALERGALLSELVERHRGAALRCERLPFDHPLYVLFSSGTTGRPKCIVHSAGGTLLQHLKEHALHCDVRPGDRVCYFTTLGWMMWNWLVSGLASEAALVLYEGSPAHPTVEALFDLAEAERVTLLGTSAKLLDSARKAGARPGDARELAALRTLASTGSPLLPEAFDWVHDAVKRDLHLASISGGTDIVSCFVLGDPTAPVRRGEIQVAGLGMAVDVYDEEGRPVRGQAGELVCTRPFPSMPIGFWGDADGARYRAAYFERFPGVWRHGDLAEVTASGGYVIHGRSDTVLNPGGVRIGTAEIYRQVEALDEVLEAVAVGLEREGDVEVVLYLRLAAGVALDDALRDRLRRRIREGASPRHVPARVLAVPDVPRTKSGKVSEVAVREAIHGRPVTNLEALANPGSLRHFAPLG